MNVVINGKEEVIAEATLGLLCLRLIDDPMIIATAVNGEFVPVTAREELALSDGDKIEILSPRQGG